MIAVTGYDQFDENTYFNDLFLIYIRFIRFCVDNTTVFQRDRWSSPVLPPEPSPESFQ